MKKIDKNLVLKEVSCFDLENTLFCGQAFRWKKTENGIYTAVVKNKIIKIRQNENEIIFLDANDEETKNLIEIYFDLNRDYKKICEELSRDKSFQTAYREYNGIRILRQDSWEALCSFIISQNNNIPRIMGIIDRFCRTFGERLDDENYTFPTYKSLKGVTAEELAPLRAGFRGKYIADAVEKLNNGEISLEEIEKMPIEQARTELCKIKGVGAKVAECTLLYGFGRVEAFPVDVWVKRIMSEMYPEGLPEFFKGNEGIAQQYLFHWRRNRKE
ncbi:MAG: DNA-3-methyladenine glycosylase 2 [Ruminococcaceae bacterium]|nr:DNA-3-methyladenine glycosylase 2 [Oscillospiraceae bacterium]